MRFSARRFVECAADPRLFHAELAARSPASQEWRSIAALYVIGCLNRRVELSRVLEVARELATLDAQRYGLLLGTVQARLRGDER